VLRRPGMAGSPNVLKVTGVRIASDELVRIAASRVATLSTRESRFFRVLGLAHLTRRVAALRADRLTLRARMCVQTFGRG
jgi:hypothetical protein